MKPEVRGKFHRSRPYIVPAAVGGAILAAAIALVSVSLGRPEPPTAPPSPAISLGEGSGPSGPVVYTVDASDEARWRFFDVSRGSVVPDPGPTGWDLAFRRFRVLVNGGDGFPGEGGVVDLGRVAFDSVRRVPGSGYVGSVAARDSTHPVLSGWYDYGFFSHLLTPRPRVYAVRTADGRYAKLQILGYYCPGPRAGCVTFRYAYRPDGTRGFDPALSTRVYMKAPGDPEPDG